MRRFCRKKVQIQSIIFTNRKNELTRDTSINILVYHKISMEVEFRLFAQNRILYSVIYHRIQI
jgi:hypothetical protein